MFYVSIKKEVTEIAGAKFETLDLANAWIVDCEAGKMWGQPTHTEIIPEVLEIKDELGEIIQAAAPEQVIEHEAEYTIEVTDITAQVEQEKTNVECLAYLASTDWMVLREMENPTKSMPDEVKAARQAARDKIIKGV